MPLGLDGVTVAFGKPGTVSIPATSVDTSGNAITQTLRNAYRTNALRRFPRRAAGRPDTSWSTKHTS